jgi:TolB-like protein/DNA-binding winged helix-turn-helix (wHTH) protein
MAPLRIGDWIVDPLHAQMTRDGDTVRLEARTLRLLLCLAERAGDVVSIDELLNEVWPGVVVTPDSVYQAVTALRRQLGDDPRQPTYIATVPRRGYRMVAKVGGGHAAAALSVPAQAAANEAFEAPGPEAPAARSRLYPRLLAIAALLGLVCAAFYLLTRAEPLAQPAATAIDPRSVAVMPFLDLTDTMNEEPFADGMTEELIDRLSQSRDLHVAPPTSSFYFKGKQVTVQQVAKALGVAYVLDGSVRKSGNTLRVSARLVRADDGFVAWSQTYDRNWSDKLMIQDDIADEAAKALKASIH